MPGSRLEIKSTANLLSEDIKLCLISASSDQYSDIISNNKRFSENDGIFKSIHSDNLWS